MKTTINKYAFSDAFKQSETYKDNFTIAGLDALFEYLEDYEESTGEQIELDIVALCCDYAEYENFAEFQKDYGTEEYPDFEELENHTTVIYTGEWEDENAPFIIQAF